MVFQAACCRKWFRASSCSPSCSSRGPFYLRTAIAAFEAVDCDPRRRLADARRRARGARLPVSRFHSPRVASALAQHLSFARGLGEFGATIMFAGSLQGDDADPLARGVRAVRRRLRHRTRDKSRAWSSPSASPAARGEAHPVMATLNVDLYHPLRSLPLSSSTLEVGAETPGARRPVRCRRVERARGDRRVAPPGARSRRARRGRPGSTPRAASTFLRIVAPLGSSSRTTPCSRT